MRRAFSFMNLAGDPVASQSRKIHSLQLGTPLAGPTFSRVPEFQIIFSFCLRNRMKQRGDNY